MQYKIPHINKWYVRVWAWLRSRVVEDWILIGCLAAFFAFVIVVSISCTPHTKIQDVDLLYLYDNKKGSMCLFYVDGVSVEQAHTLNKSWDFNHCAIETESVENLTEENDNEE